MTTTPFETAGSVEIQELTLLNGSLKSIDVLDYMSEINLMEDLFTPTMHGTMLFVDSRNLIKEFNLIGEEYFFLKFRTPTSDSIIEKFFRIYSITDRKIINDKGTQSYILNFVSAETIMNEINPLFRTFKGKISDIVTNIFIEFLKIKRSPVKKNNQLAFPDNATELIVLPTENEAKFVSPGWSPFKCINWCASKAIPEFGKACNYLFFETNKAFMFINLETLFDKNNKSTSAGTYSYNINNFNVDKNPNEKLFNINDLKIVKNFNQLDNYNNGYYGNRLLSLNIKNKQVTNTDYRTTQRYQDYTHTDKDLTQPFFAKETPFSTLSDIKFNPIHPGIHGSIPENTSSFTSSFTPFEDNVNERMPEIYGNRKTNMMELNQFKINLFVPGRSDIEVGRMIKLLYPDISPKGESDATSENLDRAYSGNYLITAINHKINSQSHMMSMEIVKDGILS